VDIRPSRELFWWHLSYTSNFHFALRGDFQGPSSHFWSLAVEEQYYLLWPWLILFTPDRWLLPLNISTIALAVAFRSLGVALGSNSLALQILPLGCFDSLGFGSLLAVLTSGERTWSYCLGLENWTRVCFGCGLSLLGSLALTSHTALGRKLEIALQGLGMALVFVALIAWSARGMDGWMGKLLSCRPLVYIGKISYGMYVYHGFMPVVCPRVFRFLGLNGFYAQFDGLANTAVTIFVAALSWNLFEAPINQLKERFNYATEHENNVSADHVRRQSTLSRIA
jgi:peptidoglycan/LPS O-acetylase OafA/YrhL